MAGSSNHPEPLDPRWELVATRNRTGRTLDARRARVGSVFGSLTVLRSDAGNHGFADCVCECGALRRINLRQLWRGQSLRCSQCASAELSDRLRRDNDIIADDKLRKMWADRYKHMVRRCTTPSDKAYKNYGARGIRVHPLWLADRRAFFAYVVRLPRWDECDLDMDREDNSRGYEPGNIRLVERIVNGNNRRTNRFVEYKGVRYTVSTFWRTHCLPGWSRSTVVYHLDLGRTTDWVVAKYRADHAGLRPAELRPS